MPDVYTHILNGRESLRKINRNDRGAMLKFEKLFYLGCMGPDIFLYHGFYPWSDNMAVIKLGRKVHNQHCGQLIAEALKYIKDRACGNWVIDDITAYIMGYICHYATDRSTHPYIFSRTGKYEKENPKTRKFRVYHKVMELSIDCQMAKLLDGSDINRLKIYELINIGENIPPALNDLYHHLFNIYFKNHVANIKGDFVNKSYRSMKRAWKVFYDPLFIKRYFFRILGLDMLFYPVSPDNRDYMNEKREEWPNPCTGDKSSKCFIELFDDSLKLSTELINASLDYLKGNLSFEQVKNIIGNFSFITNTDVTSGVDTMKYFSYLF